jgi:putative Holliday junction resolvase
VPKNKILALDPGTKRIGVAISDENQEIAFPKGIFDNTKQGLDAILDICSGEQISLIIIGKPLYPSKVYSGEALADKLRILKIPIEFVEEDYSTSEVHDEIKEITGNPSQNHVDDLSASYILKNYISNHKERR